MPPPVPRETASAPPIDTIRASSVALSVTALSAVTPTTAVPMLALFRASTPTVPFTAIVVFSTTDRASAWMSL